MVKEVKKKQTNPIHLTILILIIVNIVISTLGIFNVKTQLNKIEALKVGWEENYKIRQELVSTEAFQEGTKSYLEQQLQGSQQNQQEKQDQIQNQEQQVQQPTKEAELPIVDLTDEVFNTIEKNLKDAYIVGNKKSDIIILEYSELLCPFCKRQHNSNIINNMIEKYDIAATFRHFIVHAPATNFALWAECAGEQQWEEGFTNFIDKVFHVDNISADTINTVAEELWLNSNKFTECLANEDLKTKITDQSNEWRNLFWVSGTPWSVIINTKTKKMIFIHWALPQTSFETAIEQLME